jgi:type I restriction enzyme R subunit
VPKVDRRTRQQRLEAIEEDFEYTHKQLDRAVTAKSQIRLVLETFRDRLFTEIFPGRSTVPKTLIFAKDDAHAEEIVTTVREVFGKGNDFAAKITYAARDPKGQLQAFRTSPSLRIAVTVDMIATGTDVKPLECVFFMRDVRSAQYFEQMKGRGARTIAPADFQSVTPDAAAKTPVRHRRRGRCHRTRLRRPATQPRQDNQPQEAARQGRHPHPDRGRDRHPRLSTGQARAGAHRPDERKSELDDVAGRSVRDIVRGLVDAVDPDVQAKAIEGAADPDQARRDLLERAVEPIAASPDLRTRILELRATHDRVIDEVSVDVLLDAHGVVDTTRAKSVVESWAQYLLDHRDEITAIQLVTEAKERRIAFADIQELADRISRPPYNWTPDIIWNAYEAIDVDRVRHSDRHTLTDLVSLLRYTVGLDNELVPYAARVQERYAAWLAQQAQAGTEFSPSRGGGWTGWST